MVQGCGEELVEIHISVNGSLEKLMVTGFIPGSMEIDMRVSLKVALNTVREQKGLQTETAIMVHMKTESHLDLVSITGSTVASLRDTSKMG